MCFLYILYFSTQFAAKNVFAFSCDAINSVKGSMKIRSVVNKQLEYEHKINKLNRFNKEKNPSSFCKTNFTYYTYKLSDFPITLLELRQKIIKTFLKYGVWVYKILC